MTSPVRWLCFAVIALGSLGMGVAAYGPLASLLIVGASAAVTIAAR